jgi:hypothetical protein
MAWDERTGESGNSDAEEAGAQVAGLAACGGGAALGCRGVDGTAGRESS